MVMESQEVASIVADIPLPACPAILSEIDALIRRDDYDFEQLCKLIIKDVALSAGLIKLSNSPVYGLQKNASIQVALRMIGANTLAVYARAFLLQSVLGHNSSSTRFWDSSWRIAEQSARLAQRLHKAHHDEIFTFGLFRDVGIAVLMNNYSNYTSVLSQANQDAAGIFTQHEDREYGINHAQVGAFIAEDWQLPAHFVTAIEYHHQPQAITGGQPATPEQHRVLEMIALAQMAEFAIQRQTGLSQTHEWQKLETFCLATLSLTQDQAEALLDASAADLH